MYMFHSPINRTLYFSINCQKLSGILLSNDTLYIPGLHWLVTGQELLESNISTQHSVSET